MSERGDREKIEKYRQHNVTRASGVRTDQLDRADELGRSGVIQSKPNSHEQRCQCDDCREVTRRYGRTIGHEQGER
jgi:hypothetical protein